MMQKLIKIISQQTELIFYNMSISMKTCDRNFMICGVPAWRYIYHTLHSCDKWFCNPSDFTEPTIHVDSLDKVDISSDKVLTDDELWNYYYEVKDKITTYLSSLSDQQLYEKPVNCDFTVMELILGQYRHFMCHIGILNGITISKVNKYPVVLGLDEWKENKSDGKIFDE